MPDTSTLITPYPPHPPKIAPTAAARQMIRCPAFDIYALPLEPKWGEGTQGLSGLDNVHRHEYAGICIY